MEEKEAIEDVKAPVDDERARRKARREARRLAREQGK